MRAAPVGSRWEKFGLLGLIASKIVTPPPARRATARVHLPRVESDHPPWAIGSRHSSPQAKMYHPNSTTASAAQPVSLRGLPRAPAKTFPAHRAAADDHPHASSPQSSIAAPGPEAAQSPAGSLF